MNRCIRAPVRAAAAGATAFGVADGFEGLLDGRRTLLTPRSVGNIVHEEGTMLHTGRCQRMLEEGGLDTAAEVLSDADIDDVVVIGGDSSLRGGHALASRGRVTSQTRRTNLTFHRMAHLLAQESASRRPGWDE